MYGTVECENKNDTSEECCLTSESFHAKYCRTGTSVKYDTATQAGCWEIALDILALQSTRADLSVLVVAFSIVSQAVLKLHQRRETVPSRL